MEHANGMGIIMATKLIFIRHGESEANAEHRFTGQSNAFGLTARGHAQAEAAGKYLRRETIDAVYASDLRRAYDTACHVARWQERDLSVTANPGFREIFAGAWEGKTFDELPLLYPEDFGVWMHDIGNAVCTGGESVVQLQLRVKAAVEAVVCSHPGQTVCIGTHATPIRVMQCIWNHLPLSEMKTVPWVPNASLTEVIYEEDLSFHDVRVGYADYLSGIMTNLPKNI